MKRVLIVLTLALLFPFAVRAEEDPIPLPGPVPEAVREKFRLSPFYQKHLDAGGMPIVGSAKVRDEAFREALWIVRNMLKGREDILKALGENNVRLAIMAYDEVTTDVPEHSDLKPKLYWDRRARGLGPTPWRPAVSCGEENLLCFEGDPYAKENILVHEFAHAIHDMGLSTVDPTFDRRLREAYGRAVAQGKWKTFYAATNHHEYWAEAVQSWFDDNRENDQDHNHVNTRAELIEYDPGVAALCAEVFGEDNPWRYRKPSLRPEAERAHLAGFDPAAAPRFVWKNPPVGDTAKVVVQTVEGNITLELDARRAPATVENFLQYVADGHYNNGRFFRAVTESNQPDNAVKIAVIQARGNPDKENKLRPPVRLERTSETGLKHLDGTVSMAREGPDTAQDHFFICIGDQPELDFGGKRNPDGQGFAAFGRVVEGMDVVRKIHALPAEGQMLKEPVKIQTIIRTE